MEEITGWELDRLEEYKPQNLANTAWAFITLGENQEELLGATAQRTSVKIEEHQPQDMAYTAWASVTQGVPAEELLVALVGRELVRLAEFTSQEMLNSAAS